MSEEPIKKKVIVLKMHREKGESPMRYHERLHLTHKALNRPNGWLDDEVSIIVLSDGFEVSHTTHYDEVSLETLNRLNRKLLRAGHEFQVRHVGPGTYELVKKSEGHDEPPRYAEVMIEGWQPSDVVSGHWIAFNPTNDGRRVAAQVLRADLSFREVIRVNDRWVVDTSGAPLVSINTADVYKAIRAFVHEVFARGGKG